MDAGLSEELNDMKDIYLLGRGELYQALFTLTKDLNPNSPYITSMYYLLFVFFLGGGGNRSFSAYTEATSVSTP